MGMTVCMCENLTVKYTTCRILQNFPSIQYDKFVYKSHQKLVSWPTLELLNGGVFFIMHMHEHVLAVLSTLQYRILGAFRL
jgi:hypothetical protein